MRRGLDLFTSIGATPAAALVRTLLRQAGHLAVPRGPRPATRSHPHGLTAREADVLALLRDGLSNAAISRRLFISERTVHHHVSAVLGKLGVASRADLARPVDTTAGDRRRK
jgi:DNA-binding NarL/FixJ family response regulator